MKHFAAPSFNKSCASSPHKTRSGRNSQENLSKSIPRAARLRCLPLPTSCRESGLSRLERRPCRRPCGGREISRDRIGLRAHRSLHIENFVHHGKALAGLKVWNRFEVFSHFSLPFQVGWVAVKLSPCRVKIKDLHDKEQILPSSKDRILRYPDLL